MQAFHNDPLIKNEYITRVRKHRSAGEFVKKKGDGFGYWKDGHGSAVGCTVHGSLVSSGYKSFENELGIPAILAQLEDTIFYALPLDAATEWPELFLSVIYPGADLSNVWPQFALWLLDDPDDGVIQFAKTAEDKMLFNRVVQLLRDESYNVTEWYFRAGESASRHAAAAAAKAERWGRNHWWPTLLALRVASGAAVSALPAGNLSPDETNSPLHSWRLAVRDCMNTAIWYGKTAREAAAEDQSVEEHAFALPSPTAYVKQSKQLLKLLQTCPDL
jgi:hypothetical protein